MPGGNRVANSSIYLLVGVALDEEVLDKLLELGREEEPSAIGCGTVYISFFESNDIVFKIGDDQGACSGPPCRSSSEAVTDGAVRTSERPQVLCFHSLNDGC